MSSIPNGPLIPGDAIFSNAIISNILNSSSIDVTTTNMITLNVTGTITTTDLVSESITTTELISGPITTTGLVNISNITNTTSVTSGSLTTTGGVGISKDLYVGSIVNSYGLSVSENVDGNQGIVTLADGTAFVVNSNITSNYNRIFLTIQNTNGGTPGAVYVSNIDDGMGFNITSTSNLDTSIVAYEIFRTPNWVQPPPICFHMNSLVDLENGSSCMLRDLKYNDRVKTFYNNIIIYSPVITFTGVFPETFGASIEIFYSGTKLIVSPIHLIYASYDSINYKYIKASDIKIGMYLFDGKNPVEITDIVNSVGTGWYTPLTETGTIVVNGVVASCHTTGPHEMVHFMYYPLRLYYKLFPNKNELPNQDYQWYSIGFRRSYLGKFIGKMLQPWF